MLNISMKHLYLTLFALCLLSANACDVDNDPSSVSFDCIPAGADMEVFIVIEEEPVFDDLLAFLNAGIGDIGFDPELTGEVQLAIVVLDTGIACLSEVSGAGLSAQALTEIQSLINTMPPWTPGRQGGEDRHTQVCVQVDFINGQNVEVRSFTGRC